MAIIYFVEDDQSIGFVIQKTIEHAGYQGIGFAKGSDFLATFKAAPSDLILLDIMLPDISGLDLLKAIRKQDKNVPIMMISALQSEMDKVIALDLGADDYLTKPFGVLELASRIQAKIRKLSDPCLYQVSSLCLDDKQHSCYDASTPLSLTNKEYVLLKCLMKRPGMVVSREAIFEEVWGSDFLGETRTLDMHIKSLRTKIAEVGSKATIETVRGIGYKIQ